MSFQLATAYVELTNRGFKTVGGAIDDIKGKLTGLVKYAGGPMTTALGTAMGMLGGGLISSFTSQIGSTATNMIKLAAEAEQTEIAFGTMLGSADKAKTMLKDLASFAAATPFDMPGIKQSARTLMAFGTSQEQVLPLLKMLGDVSAGTGKDLAELSKIYGQIAATGKLDGGALMQLTDAGIPMLVTLSKQLGKTSAETKKLVESGQVSAGAVTRAFQSMASEGGLFANMMEKQSSSLGGLWSTFADSLGVIMTDVGTAIVEGFDLKTVVGDMTSFAESFRSDWMPSIVAAFQWTSENIVQPMIKGIGVIKGSIMNLVQASFQLFGQMVTGIQSIFGGIFDYMGGGFFETLASIIDAVSNFMFDWDLYWELASVSLGNQMNNMYQIAKTSLTNMWNVTKWFFVSFGTIAGNTVANIGTIFVNYFKQIRNNWQSLLNFFKTGKLEFDFTPMRESMEAIFEGVEGPKIETAQQDALRSDMDRIEAQIAKRQADRAAARKKETQEATETQMAELQIADDVVAATEDEIKEEKKKTEEKKAQTAEQKKQAAGFVSLADLADQMQQKALEKSESNISAIAKSPAGQAPASAVAGMRDVAPQAAPTASGTDMMAAINRQVMAIESLLMLARESGIKIRGMGDRVGPPPSDWKFGGAGA